MSHSSPGCRIRVIDPQELGLWHTHLGETLPENGREGVYFSTVSLEQAPKRFAPSRLAHEMTLAAKRVDEPDWLRVFLVEDEGGAVVGHADLHGGETLAELHRARVGLGLRTTHHRRGLGRALLEAVIAWARGAGLAWLDLTVLDGNSPAIGLYRALGFLEQGRVPDRFRFDGRSLTDISMTLDLRAR